MQTQRPALQGSLSDFPLEGIVRFLAESGQTGTLRLRGRQGVGSISFGEGRIVATTSPEGDGELAPENHSHSIVAGGFDEMS